MTIMSTSLSDRYVLTRDRRDNRYGIWDYHSYFWAKITDDFGVEKILNDLSYETAELWLETLTLGT
jgi:hypothetical protein